MGDLGRRYSARLAMGCSCWLRRRQCYTVESDERQRISGIRVESEILTRLHLANNIARCYSPTYKTHEQLATKGVKQNETFKSTYDSSGFGRSLNLGGMSEQRHGHDHNGAGASVPQIRSAFAAQSRKHFEGLQFRRDRDISRTIAFRT